MYRVIKSSTKVQASKQLDVSWLNGFKQIPFQDADLLSDADKKNIINRVLQQVQLNDIEWRRVESFGGVYIRNFEMSEAQYGDDTHKGAVNETFTYDISCDVVIPGTSKNNDTVYPVKCRYKGTYRRNTWA